MAIGCHFGENWATFNSSVWSHCIEAMFVVCLEVKSWFEGAEGILNFVFSKKETFRRRNFWLIWRAGNFEAENYLTD